VRSFTAASPVTAILLGILLLSSACAGTEGEVEPPPLAFHTATLTADGDVLVVGGLDLRADEPSASAFLFSHRAMQFTREIALPEGIARHTATRLASGSILIAGTSAMLITRDGAQAERIPGPNVPRALAGAVELADGRVLLVGGRTEDGDPESARIAEIFDPSVNAFHLVGATNLAHLAPHLMRAGDDTILILSDAGIERFDPVTEEFVVVDTSGIPTRSAVALDGLRLLVIGGNGHETAISAVDLRDGRRSGLGTPIRPRVGSAVAVVDRSLFVLAGASDAEHAEVDSSVEVVDLNTGVSRVQGELTAPRTRSVATALPDGAILVTGSESASQSFWEVYRPQ
jgi:hypothetical protein